MRGRGRREKEIWESNEREIDDRVRREKMKREIEKKKCHKRWEKRMRVEYRKRITRYNLIQYNTLIFLVYKVIQYFIILFQNVY